MKGRMHMKTTDRGILFGHQGAFWVGIVAVTVGVLLHLPMYLEAKDMGYRLVAMPMDMPMMIGMGLIVVGLAATIWGLIPKDSSPTLTSSAEI